MGFDSAPISMTLAEYGSAGHFCPLYGPLKCSAEKFISMIVREFFLCAAVGRRRRRVGLLGNHAADDLAHFADKILIALVCALYGMKDGLCAARFAIYCAVAFNVHLGNANGRPIMVVYSLIFEYREESLLSWLMIRKVIYRKRVLYLFLGTRIKIWDSTSYFYIFKGHLLCQ